MGRRWIEDRQERLAARGADSLGEGEVWLAFETVGVGHAAKRGLLAPKGQLRGWIEGVVAGHGEGHGAEIGFVHGVLLRSGTRMFLSTKPQ